MNRIILGILAVSLLALCVQAQVGLSYGGGCPYGARRVYSCRQCRGPCLPNYGYSYPQSYCCYYRGGSYRRCRPGYIRTRRRCYYDYDCSYGIGRGYCLRNPYGYGGSCCRRRRRW